MLSIHPTEEGDIILKNATEVLIPRNYRPELKEKLHSTHLSDAGMISLSKGKFFWPHKKNDIKDHYKSCEECLLHAPSKPSPPHEVIPDSLQLVSPNEIVHLDYCTLGGKDILVLKDKSSGWIYARITKDKSMESSTQVFDKFINSYDRPRLVVTDGGPAFQSLFVDFLKANYIQHRYSSSYHP